MRVLLAAAASGTAPFTYRWSRNGLPLSNGGNISGATSGALSVSPVGLADVGAYTVAISNACGGTVTAPVDLTLVPLTLPVLYDVNASAGSFSFTVETKTGYDYVVEFKNNLNDPAWTPLVTVPGSGGPELIFDSAPLPQMRFYRVRQQPGP